MSKPLCLNHDNKTESHGNCCPFKTFLAFQGHPVFKEEPLQIKKIKRNEIESLYLLKERWI